MPLPSARFAACVALVALGAIGVRSIVAADDPAENVDDLDGFVDMRLTGMIGGGTLDQHVNGVDNSFTYIHYDHVSLTWIGSLGLRDYGGWLWGLGGDYNYRAVNMQGQRDTLQSWTAQVDFGYALPITRNFELEAVPFVGIGRAYLKTPQNVRYNEAASSYAEGGLNVNAVFILDNGFEFGATGGLQLFETSIVNTATGLAYRFWGHDPMIGIFIGFRM